MGTSLEGCGESSAGGVMGRMEELRTPYFYVDERRLKKNLEVLRQVAQESGCRILLAQKAFSMFSCYPLLRRYLAGTTASGLYEAPLGWEEFGGETHVYSPAYREEEFQELLGYADHISFNSLTQVRKYAQRARQAGKSVGLRVNPQCSTQKDHAIYDPCAPGSRLGARADQLEGQEELIALLDGLHFHTLCEQNSDDLEVTARAFEEKIGKYLRGMKWLNLGGGHHITREDYDIPRLVSVIRGFRERYGLEVYLEPGEAVVLNAGFLVSRVEEIVSNDLEIAVLDTSAACHMPDVLEMPYRPPVQGAGKPGEYAYTYRLAGPTCLAGDVMGDYSFPQPLKEGDQVIFEDMALYTMVKTNTFNGMPLPDIRWLGEDGRMRLVKRFGYEDFKGRLS